MFHNSIRLPTILEIGENILPKVDQILKRHNLWFDTKILISTNHLFDLYRGSLEKIDFNDMAFIEKADVSEVNELEKLNFSPRDLIMGFGGGKVLDIVKYFSSQHNLAYLSIPSTLSNDGIYSPIARLNDEGRKKSFGTDPPLGIIADISVISKSPEVNILSGVGDLLSNLSALEDWKLANEKINEPINDFSFALSRMAAESIIESLDYKIKETNFLEKLAYGLIMSGLSMEISGNSRPASGSEHLISHSIDYLFPEKSVYHGLQVAYGCLLIEKRFRGKNYDLFKNSFEEVGILDVIGEKIEFSESEISEILSTSLEIRDRYTILSEKIE